MASASWMQRPERPRHSRWRRTLTSRVRAWNNTNGYVRYVRIRTKIRTNTYEYEMAQNNTYVYVFVRISVRISVRIRTYCTYSYVFFCRNPVGRSFTYGYGRIRTIRTNTYRNTYEYVRKYVRIRTNTYEYVRVRHTGFRQGTYVFLGVYTYSYVLCTYFTGKYVCIRTYWKGYTYEYVASVRIEMYH